MKIQFQTKEQYVIIHNEIKHLLLLWPKENGRQLFIVTAENEKDLQLSYPGETYSELFLQEIEPIMFQHLQANQRLFTAVLGATFRFDGQLVAMYYNREQPLKEHYFFNLDGETLTEIPDDKYENVVKAFKNDFEEYLSPC